MPRSMIVTPEDGGGGPRGVWPPRAPSGAAVAERVLVDLLGTGVLRYRRQLAGGDRNQRCAALRAIGAELTFAIVPEHGLTAEQRTRIIRSDPPLPDGRLGEAVTAVAGRRFVACAWGLVTGTGISAAHVVAEMVALLQDAAVSVAGAAPRTDARSRGVDQVAP